MSLRQSQALVYLPPPPTITILYLSFVVSVASVTLKEGYSHSRRKEAGLDMNKVWTSKGVKPRKKIKKMIKEREKRERERESQMSCFFESREHKRIIGLVHPSFPPKEAFLSNHGILIKQSSWPQNEWDFQCLHSLCYHWLFYGGKKIYH